MATPDPNTPKKTAKEPRRTPQREKVKKLFEIDENGFSRWVSIDEIKAAGLKWDANGNGRHGVYLGTPGYIWEVERAKLGRKIIRLRTAGLSRIEPVNVTIDAAIKEHFSQSKHCNITTLPIRKGQLEIDHRWGYYKHPTYRGIYASGSQQVEDFQATDKRSNVQKRSMCLKCVKTCTRPAHPELGFVEGDARLTGDHPCRGCYLAEPERYRAVNVTVRSAGEVRN